MARYEFDWVDAFTDRAFGGNGCAVVHQGAHLPVEVACAYVRETSLVECTFTGPSSVADVRVRYFLAGQEIPFAGHPTLATVAAMRDRGQIPDGRLVLETGAGLVPVEVETRGRGFHVTMQQVAPKFGSSPDAALVAAAISLPAEAIVHRPQLVSTGLPTCITLLRDMEALRAARLDPAAMEALRDWLAPDPVTGGDPALEPFLVVLGGMTEAADTFARLPLLPPNPPEDPFTGSATGAMAAYLWHHGLLDKPRFRAEQGHLMGRPGQADVELVGTMQDISGVRVGGSGFVLMRGDVDLPDQL